MEDQDVNEWSAASVKAWASEHYSEEVGDMFESKLTEYCYCTAVTITLHIVVSIYVRVCMVYV